MTPELQQQAEQAQQKLVARRACRKAIPICRGVFISHFSDDESTGVTVYLYRDSEEVGKQEFHTTANAQALIYQNAWLFSGRVVF